MACTTSMTAPNDVIGGQSLIFKLAEGHLEDAYVKKCLACIEKVCREFHLLIHMNFPSEHPVEEAGRVLLALLLKTNGLEVEVARWIDEDGGCVISRPPKALIDCLRSVHQTKWKLVKIRQEQGKSYKEVCTSVIEKCKFLIYEIRPYHSAKKGKSNLKYIQKMDILGVNK